MPIETIPERMVFMIILVILFCLIKCCELKNLRNDRFIELSGFSQGLFRFLNQSLLLVIVIENGTSILGAAVHKLSVPVARINMLPESVEQFFITYFGRIVIDLNGFYMTCLSGGYLRIGWILLMASRIARDHLHYTGQFFEIRFRTPEAAARKGCLFQILALFGYLTCHSLRNHFRFLAGIDCDQCRHGY